MPLTGIGQSVHLSTGANQNQKIVAVEGDVRLHRSQDQDEKSINGEATEHCSTNGDAESVSQEESFPVKAVLSTTAGLSISLHPQLVKEYDQKFSAVFYELKKEWTELLKQEKGITVKKCSFLLGPQLARYEDEEGNVHTIPLLDDSIEERNSADKERVERILALREELKSVVGKMWGVNGSGPMVFSTDVRDSADGPKPFLRNEQEMLLIEAIGAEDDSTVVNASIDFAIKGYERFLQKKGLKEEDKETELTGARSRIVKVELTLKELEGCLKEQKLQKDKSLEEIREQKQLIEEELQNKEITEEARTEASRKLGVQSAAAETTRSAIKELEEEIAKCSGANRLALYTAAAFASDRFLQADPKASEEELIEKATSQAEAVVQYVQGEVEARLLDAAKKEDEAAWRISRFLGRKSKVEEFNNSPKEKSSFAVEVGALLLHALPANLETLSYSKFVAEHGVGVKKDGMEGSVMQLLLAKDRRKPEEDVGVSLSADFKRSAKKIPDLQGVFNEKVVVPDFSSSEEVKKKIGNYTYTHRASLVEDRPMSEISEEESGSSPVDETRSNSDSEVSLNNNNEESQSEGEQEEREHAVSSAAQRAINLGAFIGNGIVNLGKRFIEWGIK